MERKLSSSISNGKRLRGSMPPPPLPPPSSTAAAAAAGDNRERQSAVYESIDDCCDNDDHQIYRSSSSHQRQHPPQGTRTVHPILSLLFFLFYPFCVFKQLRETNELLKSESAACVNACVMANAKFTPLT